MAASRQAGLTALLGNAMRETFKATPETTTPCSAMLRSVDISASGLHSTTDRGIRRPPIWASVMLLCGLIVA